MLHILPPCNKSAVHQPEIGGNRAGDEAFSENRS
jgi:hypothetical protein